MVTLYTDEIACIATLPLESMACNTHVVGWDYGTTDYSINLWNFFKADNGDCFDLAKQLSHIVTLTVENKLSLKDNYIETLKNFTEDLEKKKIIEIFSKF
jgi:hypothetical protein